MDITRYNASTAGMLLDDIWALIIGFLGVRSAISLRGASKKFLKLIDKMCDFSKLGVRTPASVLSLAPFGYLSSNDVFKIPQGVIVLTQKNYVVLSWSGKTLSKKSFYPTTRHERIRLAGETPQLIIITKPEPTDYVLESIRVTTFKHVVFDIVKCDFFVVDEWKGDFLRYHLQFFKCIRRSVGNAAAEFRFYAKSISGKESPESGSKKYLFVGNNFTVDIDCMMATVDNARIETRVGGKVKDGSMLEFGQYFCVLSRKLYIFDTAGIIVKKIKGGNRPRVYFDKSRIYFGDIIIFNTPAGLEVITHDSLLGIVCIGDRVVLGPKPTP